jgi:cytochrome-b5 reductase
MIGGGTGITPHFQILQAAHKNRDGCEFSLIYGNKSTKDILMKKELDNLLESNKFSFNLNYLIDKDEDGWNGLLGYVDKTKLSKYLPQPAHDTIILICGPPLMCEKSKSILIELGHDLENIYEF